MAGVESFTVTTIRDGLTLIEFPEDLCYLDRVPFTIAHNGNMIVIHSEPEVKQILDFMANVITKLRLRGQICGSD